MPVPPGGSRASGTKPERLAAGHELAIEDAVLLAALGVEATPLNPQVVLRLPLRRRLGGANDDRAEAVVRTNGGGAREEQTEMSSGGKLHLQRARL